MTHELKVYERDGGKKLNILRSEGNLPAVLYGTGLKENINLFVKANEFQKIYDEAGESSLVNVVLGDKPFTVVIKEAAVDTVTDQVIHVDFYAIDQNKELELEIELDFIGQSPCVKELGGVLIKNLNSLSIRCLPKDIIGKIAVDISSLKTFDDKILVKDLSVPATVKIMSNLDEVVVMATKIEEEKEAPVAAAVKEPEVVGKKEAGEAVAEEEQKAEAKVETKK